MSSREPPHNDPPLADVLRRDLTGSGPLVDAHPALRAAALVIDLSLTAMGLCLVLWIVMMQKWATGNAAGWVGLKAIVGGFAAAWWALTVGSQASSVRATLGKQALGLIVTDRQGGRITLLQSAARIGVIAAGWEAMTHVRFGIGLRSGWLALGLLLLPGLVGHLMAMVTPQRQTLHDLIAGTRVLQRPVSPTPANQTLAAGEGEP